jgi:hypothetical protein
MLMFDTSSGTKMQMLVFDTTGSRKEEWLIFDTNRGTKMAFWSFGQLPSKPVPQSVAASRRP